MLSGAAEAGSTVDIYLNGSGSPSYTVTANAAGNWSVTIGQLGEGGYSYIATATDGAGHTSAPSTALSFVVDATAPALAVTSVTPEDASSATVSGTIGAADAGRTVALFDYNDPQGWQASTTTDANGNWSITGVPLAVINSGLTVSASDVAGNVNSFFYGFTPPDAPTIASASIADGYVNAAHNTAAQMIGGTTQAGNAVEVYLNGSAEPSYTTTADASGNWSVTVGALADGPYSYVARAAHAGSDFSAPSSALSFVVDALAPDLATSVASADAFVATVFGTIGAADAGRTITVFDANTPQGFEVTVSSDVDGNWSAHNVPWAVINSSFGVTASDAAGNVGTSYFVYGTSNAGQSSLGFGSQQHVYGTANGFTINDGGEQDVYTDGTANDTVLNAGSIQLVFGSVFQTTVNAGEQVVWGIAYNTFIDSGVQFVGGTADGTTIASGGEQVVYSNGGTAVGTTLAGGSQLVYGSATGTAIDDGGVQYLHGVATGTTVNAGGLQAIYAEATATATDLSGGIQIDWGTATNTTIYDGTQYVWGTATGTIIFSGAQHVGSGASASDTMIMSDGVQYVHAGGAVSNTTLAGGNQYVWGTATGTTIQWGSTQHIGSGGTASNTTIDDGGVAYVDAGGSP